MKRVIVAFLLVTTTTACYDYGIDDDSSEALLALLLANATGTSTATTVISNWTRYTPTFVGMGTVTSVEIAYRQVGQDYEVRGRFTTGTCTATEAQLTLPDSATVGTQIAASGVFLAGRYGRNQPAAASFHIIATSGDGFVNFSNGDANAHTPLTGTGAFGNSENNFVMLTVPIAGL